MGDGFNTLEQLIHLTSLRHGVLSSNIANVATPDYKARDLKFEQFLNNEIMELATTSPKHIKTWEAGLSEEVEVELTQQWADRNNVEPDMEVAKITENALLFQTALHMLSTKIRMFKNALRRQT
ncbi:MAG: flagellar basal body rod protein FlgB [Nitrospirota bacterium]